MGMWNEQSKKNCKLLVTILSLKDSISTRILNLNDRQKADRMRIQKVQLLISLKRKFLIMQQTWDIWSVPEFSTQHRSQTWKRPKKNNTRESKLDHDYKNFLSNTICLTSIFQIPKPNCISPTLLQIKCQLWKFSKQQELHVSLPLK